jgi:four helix bundle protein
VAVAFQTLAAVLVPRRGYGALRDQLERASVSTVLNIAEAQGRYSPLDKAHFFAIARGSATERAAIVDILLARGLTSALQARQARNHLARLVQMLTRLLIHWRSAPAERPFSAASVIVDRDRES